MFFLFLKKRKINIYLKHFFILFDFGCGVLQFTGTSARWSSINGNPPTRGTWERLEQNKIVWWSERTAKSFAPPALLSLSPAGNSWNCDLEIVGEWRNALSLRKGALRNKSYNIWGKHCRFVFMHHLCMKWYDCSFSSPWIPVQNFLSTLQTKNYYVSYQKYLFKIFFVIRNMSTSTLELLHFLQWKKRHVSNGKKSYCCG